MSGADMLMALNLALVVATFVFGYKWLTTRLKLKQEREKRHDLFRLWINTNCSAPLHEAVKDFYGSQEEARALLRLVPNWQSALVQGLFRDPQFQKWVESARRAWEEKYPDLEITFPGVEPLADPIFSVVWKMYWVWVFKNEAGLEVDRETRATRADAFNTADLTRGSELWQRVVDKEAVKVTIEGPSHKHWGDFLLYDLEVKAAEAANAA